MEKEGTPNPTKSADTSLEANTTFSLVLKRLHIRAQTIIGRRFAIRVQFGKYGYTSSSVHIKGKDYAKDGFVALKGRGLLVIIQVR